MMMWRLRRVVEIDAAHCLPGYVGKCSNMHGHRWKFTVEIDAQELNEQGMVIDFSEIKGIICYLDHQTINEIPPFNTILPTAENLAKWASERVLERLKGGAIVRVTVEETPGASVSYVVSDV